MLKLTGTTASGVICRQGCVVGCDKRSSNESSRVERKKSWKPKIRDYNYKGRALTKHLVCIMLGDSVTAGVLLHFVEQQVKSRLSAPDLVRKTDQIAKQYIEINPNEEVSYGLLIAGYDKEPEMVYPMRHDVNFHNLEMDELDILKAYDRFYNDFDERTVFFLLTNEKNRGLNSKFR
ncbi:hypothetical protein OROMI_017480 [Orobanche minor]